MDELTHLPWLLPIFLNTRQNNHETAASLCYTSFVPSRYSIIMSTNNNNDTTIQTAILSSYSLQLLPHCLTTLTLRSINYTDDSLAALQAYSLLVHTVYTVYIIYIVSIITTVSLHSTVTTIIIISSLLLRSERRLTFSSKVPTWQQLLLLVATSGRWQCCWVVATRVVVSWYFWWHWSVECQLNITNIVPTNVAITASPVWQDVWRYCWTQR
jgi:hypothetical protein